MTHVDCRYDMSDKDWSMLEPHLPRHGNEPLQMATVHICRLHYIDKDTATIVLRKSIKNLSSIV